MLACSGIKKTIKSTQAFVMTVQNGTVRGGEMETEIPKNAEVISIYVQAGICELKFDTCWVNNMPYPVQVQKISSQFEIGIDEISGQKITISPSEKGCLYQLQVMPLPTVKEKLTEASIRIRLLRKHRSAYQTVAPIRTIIPFDSQ